MKVPNDQQNLMYKSSTLRKPLLFEFWQCVFRVVACRSGHALTKRPECSTFTTFSQFPRIPETGLKAPTHMSPYFVSYHSMEELLRIFSPRSRKTVRHGIRANWLDKSHLSSSRKSGPSASIYKLLIAFVIWRCSIWQSIAS